MSDRNELLDINQAATLLKVSETSLRRWTNAGVLPCLRVGLRRERRFGAQTCSLSWNSLGPRNAQRMGRKVQ